MCCPSLTATSLLTLFGTESYIEPRPVHPTLLPPQPLLKGLKELRGQDFPPGHMPCSRGLGDSNSPSHHPSPSHLQS